MKSIIMYTSITGNNESLADEFIKLLKNKNIETEKKDINDVDIYDVKKQNYDILILVTYTLDQGSIPDEVIDFYDEIIDCDLAKIIYGIAGYGDKYYKENFANAVNIFERQFNKTKAIKGSESLKLDLNNKMNNNDQIKRFINDLINKIGEYK